MLKRTRLQVRPMNSADAIRRVSDALVQIQGVGDVGVNGEEGLVEVAFDPEKTTERQIHSAGQPHEPLRRHLA